MATALRLMKTSFGVSDPYLADKSLTYNTMATLHIRNKSVLRRYTRLRHTISFPHRRPRSMMTLYIKSI